MHPDRHARQPDYGAGYADSQDGRWAADGLGKRRRPVRKILFAMSFAGLLAGCIGAYLFGITQPPLPPAFSPPTNPFPAGIYAEGIRSEEHTSELQSLRHLVCRLLL